MNKQYINDAVDRALSELEPLNRDFFRDLPEVICQILNELTWKWGKYSWFNKAWEEYRKHVLDAGLGGKYKMPGFIFNPYIKEQIEKDAKEGKSIYHSEELEHHGIKGQKWGVRRYQNEDGTLTNDGKIRRDRERYQRAAGAGFGALVGATIGLSSNLLTTKIFNANGQIISSKTYFSGKRKPSGSLTGGSKLRIVGRTLAGAIIGGFAGKKMADIRANNQRAKEWREFQNKAVENQLNK